MSDYDAAQAALTARGPGRMVPDLERITTLLGLLGDPQLAYPTVHVTGTNGKGSIVRMVGALCSAAGLSAGTYTSPDLQSVRERLSLAGRPIGTARFAALHEEVDALAQLVDERGPDQVTYFEMLTAMALAWFADVPVDVGVIEVGMGGRWDATNLVRGDVAVLAEIDVDHPQLGGTPVEVASEKVGIVKPGSIVVNAEQASEVQALVERAVTDNDGSLQQLGRDLEVVDRRVAVGGQLVTLRVGERVVDDILLPLHGAHQARNAVLALGAFAALTGASFDVMEDDVVRHGLGAVQVPGRLEVVQRDPTVVLDGAHNPHGARAVVAALTEAFEFRDLILVVGILDDKDVTGILRELRDAVSHVIVTTSPSPRAAPLERITAAAEEVWKDRGVPIDAIADLDAALAVAEGLAAVGDGVLVAGSLITVGAARDRYLPLADDEGGDDVVFAPDDEDELDEDDLAEATELLSDEAAFSSALDTLLDDVDLDADPYEPDDVSDGDHDADDEGVDDR
ncbi:bifunctional folylpolyglutamate synthase/dihydrofolate synthase [Nitriliruptor alkaliphilus]|uniref:bifunctional folylpolyglutamate synthase/dihydrofolate synthase n=1 Tax=Nitriliruptor alkaliphilus TaxID=427918 RepID=UPI00069636E6|nr:folylpolyglutamate synthase/dihydrofolate synthase family protein [Nitriliruptor alkaliphilus]